MNIKITSVNGHVENFDLKYCSTIKIKMNKSEHDKIKKFYDREIYTLVLKNNKEKDERTL